MSILSLSTAISLVWTTTKFSQRIPETITQAMAIRDGKIFALGSNDEMLSLAGPGTRVMDVQGKTVVPGFVDTHVHPESTIARSGDDDERAVYQWAPGIHTAVLLQATSEATLEPSEMSWTKPNQTMESGCISYWCLMKRRIIQTLAH